MEFLDKLVLPQSSEHIQLLHYLLMLLSFLFIPFIGALFGGAFLSLFYKFKGIKEDNRLYLKFSHDIIELVTINKSVGIIIGIMPLLGAVIMYAQLLHKTDAATVTYLSASFFLITIGIILIYTYRYSQTFAGIFKSIKNYEPADEELAEKITLFRKGNESLSNKSGWYGIIIMFLGLWIFIAGITLSLLPEAWGTERVIYFLFSWRVLSMFIQFIAVSFTITGAAVLFGFFYWEGGRKITDEKYRNFIKSLGIKISFTAALILPIFLTINIFALPKDSLSGTLFTFTLIGLLLLFWAYHLLYATIKYNTLKYTGQIFFILLSGILAFIVKDQLAVKNATRLQAAKLSAEFNQYLTDLRGDTGAEEVSGQQIFDVRCSACHRFDQSLVGPAYNKVLQKYEGKMDELVSYILNPVKVDPQFPPMPDPGLKPNEAKAVADYIMQTYKQ